MGRSVSTPSNTVYVSYAAFDTNEHQCGSCEETFWQYGTRQAKAGDCEHDENTPDDEQEDVKCCPQCGEHEDNCYYRDPSYEFEWHRDDFAEQMCKAFPSVSKCDSWLGRGNSEDHAVAENQFVFFGVSEYCGLVAMWVAAKDADYDQSAGWEALRDRWLSQIQQKFRKHAQTCFGQALISQGTFSNGEQFFQPMNGQQQGSMGLGFTSKEGWL